MMVTGMVEKIHIYEKDVLDQWYKYLQHMYLSMDWFVAESAIKDYSRVQMSSTRRKGYVFLCNYTLNYYNM